MININNKTQKIISIVQEFFNEGENNEDYIHNVKVFCLGKKDGNYNDIINLEIDIDTVILFLKILIGNQHISWLDNDKEKGKLSLQTLLYYYQNYNN